MTAKIITFLWRNEPGSAFSHVVAFRLGCTNSLPKIILAKQKSNWWNQNDEIRFRFIHHHTQSKNILGYSKHSRSLLKTFFICCKMCYNYCKKIQLKIKKFIKELQTIQQQNQKHSRKLRNMTTKPKNRAANECFQIYCRVLLVRFRFVNVFCTFCIRPVWALENDLEINK